MTLALHVLTAVTALFFSLLGLSKVLALPDMRRRAAHVGRTVAEYRGIGTLELAGAAGLALGLLVPGLGFLAASGLLLLLCGAVASHVRRGDGVAELAPALLAAALVVGYISLLPHATA